VIAWHEIDCVLFDMDGTLLDLHFDNYFWLEHLPLRYGQHHQLSTSDAKQLLYPQFHAKRGSLDWYSVDYWTHALNMDIEALKKEVVDRIALRPNAVEFLQWLQAQGKRCLLITNAHRKSLELKMAHTALDDYFECMISSHDFGFAKEHDAFWQRLALDFDVTLNRAIFFDDSLDVLQAAQRNGVAKVCGIVKPDSQKSENNVAPFTSIYDFRELMVSVT
jgi:putative hydrolase of the HAD superfamily